MEFEVFTAINDVRFFSEIEGLENWSEKVCREAWEIALLHDDTLPCETVEVSLLLTDDEDIQRINREYRGKDKPTNVISFASIDSDDPDDGIFIAGDIVISFDTIKKEASENGISFKERFTHLLVHGMLHLAGFDHEEDGEAETMESIEAKVLEKFKIKNPYAG